MNLNFIIWPSWNNFEKPFEVAKYLPFRDKSILTEYHYSAPRRVTTLPKQQRCAAAHIRAIARCCVCVFFFYPHQICIRYICISKLKSNFYRVICHTRKRTTDGRVMDDSHEKKARNERRFVAPLRTSFLYSKNSQLRLFVVRIN